MCVRVHVLVCERVCVHVCRYSCVSMCSCVFIRVGMYTRVPYARACTCVRAFVCSCVSMCSCVHVCVHMVRWQDRIPGGSAWETQT